MFPYWVRHSLQAQLWMPLGSMFRPVWGSGKTQPHWCTKRFDPAGIVMLNIRLVVLLYTSIQLNSLSMIFLSQPCKESPIQISLTFSSGQWLQTSLPIKDGCLGVRRVSSLALSAFLASAANTQSLQARITDGFHMSQDTVFQSLLHGLFFETSPIPLPSK